jgi:hypothetical protein
MTADELAGLKLHGWRNIAISLNDRIVCVIASLRALLAASKQNT